MVASPAPFRGTESLSFYMKRPERFIKPTLILGRLFALGPPEKESRPRAELEEGEVESPEDTESKPSSSPLKRPPLRGSAASSLMTSSHG